MGKLNSTLDTAEEIVHEKETKFKEIPRLKYGEMDGKYRREYKTYWFKLFREISVRILTDH